MGCMFGSYYSRYFFKLDEQQREQYYTTLCFAQLLFGFIELLFILIGFGIYAHFQKIEFPVFPYALLSFTSIIFNNSFNFLLLNYKLRKDAKSFFKISVYNIVISVALIFLFVVILKMGALGRIMATFFATLIFGITVFLKLYSKLVFDKNIIIDAMKFCWPLMIAGSMNYFFTGIDRVMLLSLNDTTTLGLYNIAAAIAGYLVLFQNSISQTFQPDIFKAVAENNKAKICKVLVGLNLLYTIPVVAFIIMAPLVMKILTFGRYTEAYHFARILALQNITSGLYYSLSSLLIAYGYSKVTLINKILGTIVSIIMFKFLIDTYGFYGAAWGQVSAFFIMSLISFSYISYKLIKKNKTKGN